MAAEALDGLRGAAALPEADEPEAVHAAVAEGVEFFVGNLVEAGDERPYWSDELMQPDIGALGDEHDVGHPLDVGAEALIFDVGCAELRARRRGCPSRTGASVGGARLRLRRRGGESASRWRSLLL